MMHVPPTLVKEWVPSLHTKAQQDAYLIAFEAFHVLCNQIVSSWPSEEGEDLLKKGLEALRTATDISTKFKDIPPEARSEETSKLFTSPEETYQELLEQLNACSSKKELAEWYQQTRPAREKITSNPHRDNLFDAIRQKQVNLGKINHDS